MAEKIVAEKKTYGIFIILLILTITTFEVAFFDLGHWNTPVALGIAFAKATLIALYFMHARYSEWLTRVIIGAGLFWLGILFVLVLSDYLTRAPRGISIR
jgi:cytochrome c oxidase subunit 4